MRTWDILKRWEAQLQAASGGALEDNASLVTLRGGDIDTPAPLNAPLLVHFQLQSEEKALLCSSLVS